MQKETMNLIISEMELLIMHGHQNECMLDINRHRSTAQDQHIKSKKGMLIGWKLAAVKKKKHEYALKCQRLCLKCLKAENISQKKRQGEGLQDDAGKTSRRKCVYQDGAVGLRQGFKGVGE